MEAIIEQDIETVERLLIYENPEITKITHEVQSRLAILNRITEQNIKPRQLAGITNTLFSIGQYVLELQLKENRQLKKLNDSGIKVNAELPEHLQRLKNDLTSWYNYRDHPAQNKFAFLKVDEETVEVDSEELEKYFVQRQMKIYLEGSRLKEFNFLKSLATYMNVMKTEYSEVSASSFLSKRFTADPSQACIGSVGKIMVKMTYFLNRN